jgi:hypothetical protein
MPMQSRVALVEPCAAERSSTPRFGSVAFAAKNNRAVQRGLGSRVALRRNARPQALMVPQNALWPNRSLERTATGKALGPRGGQWHHSPRGPSALPVAAAQLQR